MMGFRKSLICIFLGSSLNALSQNPSDLPVKKYQASHCLLLQNTLEQNQCQKTAQSIGDQKLDNTEDAGLFTAQCTTEDCRTLESFLLERLFVRPETCELEDNTTRINCLAATQALSDGVSLKRLESVLAQQQSQNRIGLNKIAIANKDRKVSQHWPKPAKEWWASKSRQDQDDMLRLRNIFPHLFRSAVLTGPKLMDPRFNERKNSAAEISEFRQNAAPELKNYMEEDKQAIGWELECWLTHMKMDSEDNLILKSILGEKDENGSWNKWYDTYGRLLFQTDASVRIGETDNELPALKVEFESRYGEYAQPYVEIISAPLVRSKVPGTQFTNQNIKRTMVLIPELLRIHKKLTVEEWIRKIQKETDSLGITWEEGLSSWTSKDLQRSDLLNAEEKERLAKSTKQDFLQNEMYFAGDNGGRYCIVQANTDVFLDQFYTSPYLIQSMSYNYDYNNRSLYALALKWTNREMQRYVIDKVKAGFPAQVLNDQDPRNYVAGIMTLSFYQAMIRAAMLQRHSTMEKNTIQQLIKLPITDLARLPSLSVNEKALLLELNGRFQNSKQQDLDQEDQDVLSTFLNELGGYGLAKERLEAHYEKLQDFLANWYLKDTFQQRYSDDLTDAQGKILEYGNAIDHECISGADGTCTLPVELGKPLHAFVKEGRTGIVVETRHSEAPFNFAYFWENEPVCCDWDGRFWLKTDGEGSSPARPL